MSEALFTVVITAYNERELVPKAIRSVLGQTRPDWNLIVVDDGSSDGTADVVRTFERQDPRVRLIVQPNAGLSAARNTAINASGTPLLCFLDADDLWLPDYLAAMASALDANPDAGVAYTDAWALDAESNRFRRATAMSACQPPEVVPRDPAEMMKLLVRQNFIWVSTTARRRALEDAGLFRVDFRMTEDLELWFRVLKHGYGIVRAPGGVLGIKREREEALSRRDLEMTANLQRVMAIVAEDTEMPGSVREASAARIEELERWRLALSGESRWLALTLAARRAVGRMRRAALGWRDWRREPPPEVRAAFPDQDTLVRAARQRSVNR